MTLGLGIAIAAVWMFPVAVTLSKWTTGIAFFMAMITATAVTGFLVALR